MNTCFRPSRRLSLAALAAAFAAVLVHTVEAGIDLQDFASSWTYAAAGADWSGSDASGQPWLCSSGQQQSPLNLPALGAAANALKTAGHNRAQINLGQLVANGSDIKVQRDPHGALRITWPAHAAADATIGIPVPADARDLASTLSLVGGATSGLITATALELQLHTPSEHLLEGRSFLLETQLLARTQAAAGAAGCAPGGCLVALSVLWELSADDSGGDGGGGCGWSGSSCGSAWLEPLLASLPGPNADESYLAPGTSLNLSGLLPPGNTSYLAYPGSLTAPPCTEGVLWMVMATPQRMALGQWQRLAAAAGACGPDGDDTPGSAAPAPMDATPPPMPVAAATSPAPAVADDAATAPAGAVAPPAARGARVPAAPADAGAPASSVPATAAGDPSAAPLGTAGGAGGAHVAAPAGTAAAAGPPARRRHLFEPAAAAAAAAALTPTPAPAASPAPSYTCRIPLGPHGNARLLQPPRGRPVVTFVDTPPQPPQPPSGTAYVGGIVDYIPEDKTRALAAGATAGIVVGTLGGVGLTVLVGVLVYRESKRRRIKRLSLGWADERSAGAAAGPWATKGVESQFLMSDSF